MTHLGSSRTKRRLISKLAPKVLVHSLLLLGAMVFAFPFLWLVSTSLKPESQIFVMPPSLIPNPIMVENYLNMFKYFPFARFFMNSVIITALTMLGVIASCSLVAYSFSRLRWPGRNFCFMLLLSTMMLPPQVTMIPLYITFRKLGWIDTFYPLWVPAWFGTPFYIFLLRQFFLTIPNELEDAAKIDGCSFARTFFSVMMPLMKPALTTVAIFTFRSAWNDFMGPLIYINSTEKLPLALGLRLFQTQHGGEWGMMMAAATIMILPVAVLFVMLQQYFVKGIVLTGLKA